MTAKLGQPMRFVLVGVAGYLLNLGAFAAFLVLGTPYLAGSILAYFLSNAGMYVGNRSFTFRLGHAGLVHGYVRYALVGGVVAGLSALVLAVLVEGAAIDPRLGQAVSLALVTPVAFVLSKRWAFQPRTA